MKKGYLKTLNISKKEIEEHRTRTESHRNGKDGDDSNVISPPLSLNRSPSISWAGHLAGMPRALSDFESQGIQGLVRESELNSSPGFRVHGALADPCLKPSSDHSAVCVSLSLWKCTSNPRPPCC